MAYNFKGSHHQGKKDVLQLRWWHQITHCESTHLKGVHGRSIGTGQNFCSLITFLLEVVASFANPCLQWLLNGKFKNGALSESFCYWLVFLKKLFLFLCLLPLSLALSLSPSPSRVHMNSWNFSHSLYNNQLLSFLVLKLSQIWPSQGGLFWHTSIIFDSSLLLVQVDDQGSPHTSMPQTWNHPFLQGRWHLSAGSWIFKPRSGLES